ncbi:hypothetical protein RchiOBHm_Chr1g0381811 [Rosa chinensis]|uniref:Uncharacterized protein n=1 Tax=Rosa chinensis TaxID=74649 RepID=A0A2P6SP78_ROSCH|nr:hypothetical protein RchiOBHm_Chr1g0381811 [Rosa chinensis]
MWVSGSLERAFEMQIIPWPFPPSSSPFLPLFEIIYGCRIHCHLKYACDTVYTNGSGCADLQNPYGRVTIHRRR